MISCSTSSNNCLLSVIFVYITPYSHMEMLKFLKRNGHFSMLKVSLRQMKVREFERIFRKRSLTLYLWQMFPFFSMFNCMNLCKLIFNLSFLIYSSCSQGLIQTTLDIMCYDVQHRVLSVVKVNKVLIVLFLLRVIYFPLDQDSCSQVLKAAFRQRVRLQI